MTFTLKKLIPLILILNFNAGCISIPRLFGIKAPDTGVATLKKPKTPKQHAKKLCRLGMTIGFAALIIGVALLVIGKVAPKIAVTAILSGLAVFITSYFVETYLEPILYTFLGLLVLAIVFVLWRNWEKLKAMAQFTDETIKQGHLSPEAIHNAASKTIGPQGTRLREEIKAVVKSARK